MTEVVVKSKPASYWIITVVCWAATAALIGLALWSLHSGDTVSFIGFSLFAARLLVAAFRTKQP